MKKNKRAKPVKTIKNQRKYQPPEAKVSDLLPDLLLVEWI